MKNMNGDLLWLVQVVDKWNAPHTFACVEQQNEGGRRGLFWSDFVEDDHKVNQYTQQQWEQARIDLGLDSPDSEENGEKQMNTNLEWIAKNGGDIPPGATCAQYDGRIGKNSFHWFHYDINCYEGRGDVVFTVDEIKRARKELEQQEYGGGWHNHSGGAQPVPNSANVEVMFRSGTLAESNAGTWFWHHGGEDSDIVSYRLSDNEVTEEEERAFKEIEAKKTKKYSAYFKDVRHLDYIDVYRTVSLFDCDKHGHALSHAAKKLLLTGNRTGGKDVETDVREAIDSLQRWLEMRKEDQFI